MTNLAASLLTTWAVVATAIAMMLTVLATEGRGDPGDERPGALVWIPVACLLALGWPVWLAAGLAWGAVVLVGVGLEEAFRRL
jgi:hypothetical protein